MPHSVAAPARAVAIDRGADMLDAMARWISEHIAEDAGWAVRLSVAP